MTDPIRFMRPLQKEPFGGHPADQPQLNASKHKLRVKDRLPVPWTGPLLTADVYILLGNPGHHRGDTKRDKQKDYQDYWRSMIRTGKKPMIGLVTGSVNEVTWWDRILKGIFESREEAAKRVCGLEFCMYASKDTSAWPPIVRFGGLASQRVMKDYLHDVLVPRATKGNCLIVCPRAFNEWGLIDGVYRNVVVDPQRGGWVTRNTKGGRAILEFLGR